MAKRLCIGYGLRACFSQYDMQIDIDLSCNLLQWKSLFLNEVNLIATQEISSDNSALYLEAAQDVLSLADKINASRSTSSLLASIECDGKTGKKMYGICGLFFGMNPGKRKLYPIYYVLKLANRILMENISAQIRAEYPLPLN